MTNIFFRALRRSLKMVGLELRVIEKSNTPSNTTLYSETGLPLHTLNEIFRTVRFSAPENPHLLRVERDLHVKRYDQAVQELYGFFTSYVFPSLPEREGRITLLGCLQGTGLSEGMWILQALNNSLFLEGDICEFGCAQGATSALIANEIRSTNKALWVFDSFRGLPSPTAEDVLINDIFDLGTIEAYTGTMSYPKEVVQSKLSAINFPNERTHLVEGFVEQTIKQNPLPGKICFAYVDFDFYQPIRTALEFLVEHISLGGKIVVDDYGFFSSGAQQAVDEFMKAHENSFLMELPPKWAGAFAILTRC